MIAVVGCGNANRSDDGVGPEVIRCLKAREIAADPGVRLVDAGTDGMAAMFAARGCRTLVIVDACRTGSPPGALFEVPGHELETAHEPALNLHDFRWDHALHAGRRMLRDAFPTDVTVFLIEAATVAFGIELSPSVAATAARATARIEQLVADRLASDHLTPDRIAPTRLAEAEPSGP